MPDGRSVGGLWVVCESTRRGSLCDGYGFKFTVPPNQLIIMTVWCVALCSPTCSNDTDRPTEARRGRASLPYFMSSAEDIEWRGKVVHLREHTKAIVQQQSNSPLFPLFQEQLNSSGVKRCAVSPHKVLVKSKVRIMNYRCNWVVHKMCNVNALTLFWTCELKSVPIIIAARRRIIAVPYQTTHRRPPRRPHRQLMWFSPGEKSDSAFVKFSRAIITMITLTNAPFLLVMISYAVSVLSTGKSAPKYSMFIVGEITACGFSFERFSQLRS